MFFFLVQSQDLQLRGSCAETSTRILFLLHMEETRDCLGSVVKVEEENKDHVQTQVERERLNVLYVRPCQYGGDAEASIQSPGAQSSYMVVNKTEERVSPKVEEEEQDINPMSTGDLKKEIKTEEEQETEREGLHVQYVRPSPYYRDAEAGIQSSYMVANKTEERVSPKVEEEQDINPISTGDLKIEIKMEEERETEREGLHVQYVQPCPYYRDAEAGIQSPRAQSSYMAVYKMKEKVVIKVVEKGQDINLMSTGDLKKEIKTEEERETERKGLHVQYVQPCPYYGDAEAGIQSPGAQSSYMVVNKTEERVSPKVEEKGQDINPMSTGDLKKDVKTEGKRQAPYVCYVRPCQYGGDTEAGIQSPGAKSSYMAVYKMKEKVIIKVVEKGQDINLKSTGDLKNGESSHHLLIFLALPIVCCRRVFESPQAPWLSRNCYFCTSCSYTLRSDKRIR
ncbi:uncharacterized protein LOC142183062 [Leptodactylus fuscus]|uniref:uncharacterized protein LOC142183062 n=1 Tax=Leptodactylus fuscus TaxID=238119 RepID=UPI003F4F0842